MHHSVLEYRIFAIQEFIKYILDQRQTFVIMIAEIEVRPIDDLRGDELEDGRVSWGIDLGDHIDADLLQILLHLAIIILRPDIFAIIRIQLRIFLAFHHERGGILSAQSAVFIDMQMQRIQLEPCHIAAHFLDIVH